MTKKIIYTFLSLFILGAGLEGCQNKVNDKSTNDQNKQATTDGTTSSIGQNPTNSTGSTGKAIENHSTSTPDSAKYYNRTTNSTSGSSTK
jgi:hypothetical protein